MSGAPANSRRFAAYALLLGAIGGVVIGIGLASGQWPGWARDAGGPTTRAARPVSHGGDPLDAFDLAGLLEPRDEIRPGGPRKDGIPSIVDPAHVAAGEAPFLEPDDRVVGVTVGGVTRAYPIRLLNYHEIVNDVLGEVPIAVVYCPLCDSVSVVDRRLDDATLEFGVSGLLLHSNVLMYDRTHDALWTQVGARAISGPMAGRALTHLSGWEIAPFGAWAARHPGASVVSFETGHPRDYRRKPYERYFDHDRLSFPVARDDRLPRHKIPVIGIRYGDAAWAVPVDEIERAPGGRLVVPVGEERVVLLRQPGSRDVAVLEAPAEARVIHTFWFAWAAFHPETVIWQPGDGTTAPAHGP